MNPRHCNVRRGRARAARAGFTLVELVTAMGISSVLFLALGDALYISAKALPAKDDPMRASMMAAQALDQIAGEIESAVYVTRLGPTSIAFTVADRDGDGLPERITYSWSGTQGAPLVRTYNGEAWSVVDTVSAFSMVPTLRYVSETYPGPGVEDGTASILQDTTSASNLGTQSMGSTNTTNYGQYFAPTFSSDVIGWRPTKAVIWAMTNRTPGTYIVQMQPANASLVPTNTVLEQYTADVSTLTSSMLPQTFNFTTLNRQSPGDAICLTVMWGSGQGPGKFQSNGVYSGLLKTSSTPTSWSSSSNNCLSAQLFGVPMRSTASQTATTSYLMSVGLTLRAGAATNTDMQTSALVCNHPELTAGLWEAKFDRDPTGVDVNGDGTLDWTLGSGSSVSSGALAGGAWATSSDTLTTQPANDFATTTVVDVRMQSLAAGATAGFKIAGAWSGSQCAAVTASLVLQADGTQTLTLTRATGASASTQLVSFGQLPAQPTDLHLVIDPVAMGVAVSVNGVQRGTFPLALSSVPGVAHGASIFATGGSTKFFYTRVRVLDTTNNVLN